MIWFLLCLILCCLTRMISDSDNKILSSCRIEPAMNKITGSLLEWTIEVFVSYYFNLLAVLAISTCWLSIYIPIYHYHKNWTNVRWNKKGTIIETIGKLKWSSVTFTNRFVIFSFFLDMPRRLKLGHTYDYSIHCIKISNFEICLLNDDFAKLQEVKSKTILSINTCTRLGLYVFIEVNKFSYHLFALLRMRSLLVLTIFQLYVYKWSTNEFF